MSTERAGVVLAGGRSTRFGDVDKAFASLAGRPLLAHVLDGLEPVVRRVAVSCHDDQVGHIEELVDCSEWDLVVEPVPDLTPGGGPAAGLAASLGTVDADAVAVVACDTPLVEPGVLTSLYERLEDHDVAVPRVDDRLRPTLAVYRTEPTREACRRSLEDGDGSLHGALDRLDVVVAEDATTRASPAVFLDVNTRSDLEDARDALDG